MGRPSKAKSLSRPDVIAAAIAVLDQEGEAALGVNRVARALRIQPPAIYKHVAGKAGLWRAVALTLWRQYLAECQSQMSGITDAFTLFQVSARATRNFARSHPARYRVMMQYQLRPDDPEEAELIQTALQILQSTLCLTDLNADALIDVMRFVNAAIYGFLIREQADLMTIARSADASFEVMLEALWVAIAHIQQTSNHTDSQ